MKRTIRFIKKSVSLLMIVLCGAFILISCNNETTGIKETNTELYMDENDTKTKDCNLEYTELGNISVRYVTFDLIKKYIPDKIIDISSKTTTADKTLVMISTNSIVNNFQIHELLWSKGQFKSEELLYEVSEFTPEKPLFFKISISDSLQLKGISYIDQSDKNHNMFMHRNNSNNALFLGRIQTISN